MHVSNFPNIRAQGPSSPINYGRFVITESPIFAWMSPMSTPSMPGFKPREWFLIVRHKEMALCGRPTGEIQTAMSSNCWK
jgi:hypothetical protein